MSTGQLRSAVLAAMAVTPDTPVSFAELCLVLAAAASALSPDPYEDLALKLDSLLSERVLSSFHVGVRA